MGFTRAFAEKGYGLLATEDVVENIPKVIKDLTKSP
jgi:hypothetical protein